MPITLGFIATQTLEVTNPHAVVRAIACGGIINRVPTLSQFKWALSQAEPYVDCDFWLPYAKFRGQLYMKPEFMGILNYFSGTTLDPESLARIEPEAFYKRIVPQVEAVDPNGALAEVAKQAHWLGHPTGAINAGDPEWADQLDILYTEVRVASANGTLLTDAKKIKRMLKV